MAHAYRFGIEEELFLASTRSRSAPREVPRDFHDEARRRLEAVEREMLQSQIEICTPPSASFSEARERLTALRSGLAGVARDYGLKVFAAGTHPTALWSEQKPTRKARYRKMIEDLQIVGRRSVVCGLHVHVEVPRPEARIDLMRRLLPFLPLLLALSTSSPFWERERTGLAGYRARVYAELPRTGLPELFEDMADYERYVAAMTQAKAVEDATFFWWHIRPSIRYPTLELRVADSCTRLSDSLAVAALFRCLVRLVERRPEIHAHMTGASRGFVMENLWRAEREGVHASLIDETSASAVPVRKAVDALLDLVAEDAAALGCESEVAHARHIARDGTSADRQLAVHEAALAAGKSPRVALSAVIDWLAEATKAG
ncbi:carboxylate-amine ligase [Methylobacterium organophilum]|uniref:Putative glutamate--cysteine ligase 2 n=1 Tax=Methylobacterium organophilum TaxID=410 RepID=A0ABQ4T564_METOR|nr:carboxylate-amine ligase [Methylobacterium organophilum]GJE26763.1 Putative glutamate--cysteine ligase 2 [Methylobacterium organophilum]